MESIVGVDTALIFWLHEHIVTGALSPGMIALSTAGNFGALWILLGLVLLYPTKYRRTGVAIFIALGFSLIVGNGLLKHLVMRARPCIDYPFVTMLVHLPAATDFSFPSGHTFGSFAAAAALFNGVRRRWGVAALGLAAAIGFSRIYLFLHYPSDVLAGAVLGIAFGALAWCLSGWLVAWSKTWCRIDNEKTELQ